METKILTVQESSKALFEAAVSKLAKAARKMGLTPEPSVKWLWDTKREAEKRVTTVLTQEGEASQTTDKFIVSVLDAELTLPVIGRTAQDWQVIGTLQKTDREENEIYTTREFSEAMKAYASAKLTCAHCNANRHRVRGMVIQHTATGAQKLLGIECGQYYVGDAAKAILALEFQAMLVSIVSMDGDDGGDFWTGGNAGRTLATWDTQEVLETCAMYIRLLGYQPMRFTDKYGNVDYNPHGTAATVKSHLSGSSITEFTVTQEDKDKAAEIIDFLAAFEGEESSLLIDAKETCARPWVSENSIGLCAASFPAIENFKRKQAIRELCKNSKHQGATGARIAITGQVLMVKFLGDGDFGPRNLVKIADEAGNVFAWFTGATELEEGQQITGKATVKKHDAYDGIAQTVISRFQEPRQKAPKPGGEPQTPAPAPQNVLAAPCEAESSQN